MSEKRFQCGDRVMVQMLPFNHERPATVTRASATFYSVMFDGDDVSFAGFFPWDLKPATGVFAARSKKADSFREQQGEVNHA